MRKFVLGYIVSGLALVVACFAFDLAAWLVAIGFGCIIAGFMLLIPLPRQPHPDAISLPTYGRRTGRRRPF